MTPDAARLLDEALQLPLSERADLAALLIGSLEAADDADATAAWEAEVGRRVEELDAGTVNTIPWDEVRRRLRGTTHGQGGS